MILVDANLLIYAVNADSAHHREARRWLEQTLSGPTPVGFAWVVLLAFLRVTTQASVFPQPLAPERALDYVDSWLDQPFASAVAPGPGHWAILKTLLRHTGAAGNLTSDAHLAALAIEQECTVYSTDSDFQRFPGVECHNPLTG